MIQTETQESWETEIQEIPEIEDAVEETPDAEKYNFAEMNGVSIDFTLAEDIQEEDITEPEEIVTTRTVSQHPFLKILVIGGVILVVVMLIGGVINGSMNALKLAATKKIEPDQKSQQETQNEVENEAGTDKTALALTRQSMEIQKMRDIKATPNVTPNVTPKIAPTPVSTSVPTIRATREQPRAVVQRPTYRTPTVVKPSPVYKPQPISQQQSIAKIPVTDPMEEWLAVANIGNYSSTNTNSGEPDKKIEGGAKVKTVSVSNVNQDTPQPPPTNYDGKRVLVGTRAAGVMETPVAWVGSRVNQQQPNSLIRLTQPLKAFDGSEVLPKGAYVVTTISATNSEIAQMTAVSALVNINGKTEEKPLAQNAVLVLGKNGNLLKAESRQGGSNFGSSLMASLLSGISKVAEIQNRANSETTISSLGTTTSTTNNGEKNLTAAFAQGSINEILGRMKSSNEQQIQQLQQQQKVFVIEAGKEVQIFVNQSISI